MKEKNWRGICRAAAALLAAAAVGGLQGCSREIDAAQAQAINGLIYKLNDSDPFTGTIKNVAPHLVPGGGREGVSCRRQFKNGRADGETTCHAQNGAKVLEQSWSEGLRNGPEKAWAAKDGTKFFEREWKAGKENGTFDLYNVENGKLVSHQEFKNGSLDGNEKAWDLTGQHLLVDLVWKDGRETGYRKSEDTEEHLQGGKRHGLVRTYELRADAKGFHDHIDENVARYRLGLGKAFVGIYEGAKLVKEDKYENGAKIGGEEPKSGPMNSTTCVGIWIKAYRKSAGEDASVTMDQWQEWEGLCAQGKVPA